MPSTTPYKRGDIVLVPFPFTDLSSSKRRPALVVSPDSFNMSRRDVVLVAVSSQISTDPHAIVVGEHDFASGKLPKTSIIRITKVFTIHSALIVKRICVLNHQKLDEALKTIREFYS